MDYIYGKLNNKVKAVEYNGINSDTTNITIDNSDRENRTIKVDVVKTPGTLTINNTNGESVSFNGSIDKNITIDSPTTEQYQELVTKVDSIENVLPTDINLESHFLYANIVLERDGKTIAGQKKLAQIPDWKPITNAASIYPVPMQVMMSSGPVGGKFVAVDTQVYFPGNTHNTVMFLRNVGTVDKPVWNAFDVDKTIESDGIQTLLTDKSIRANGIRTDKNIITNGGFIAFKEETDLAKILYNVGELRYEITGYGAGSYPFTVYLQTDYDWDKYDDAYILTNRNIKTICGNDLYSTTGGDIPLTSIIPSSTELDIARLKIDGSVVLQSYQGIVQAVFNTLAVGDMMEGRRVLITSTGDVYTYSESGSAPTLRYSNSTGNLTLTGDISAKNLTTSGDVTVQGNLSVSGTTTTVDTETLKVKDNIIVTNSDKAQLLELSGIAINTNATDTFGIMYNPTSNTVNLGLGKIDSTGKFTYNENEGLPLAIRDSNSSFTQDHLISWSTDKNKLVDSGIDKNKVAQTNKENTFVKGQVFKKSIKLDSEDTEGAIPEITITAVEQNQLELTGFGSLIIDIPGATQGKVLNTKNTKTINNTSLYDNTQGNISIPVVKANDNNLTDFSSELESIRITNDGKSGRYYIPSYRMIKRLHITNIATGTLILKANESTDLTKLLDVDMGYNWQYDMDSINLSELFEKDCGKIDILNCDSAIEYILQFGTDGSYGSFIVDKTNRYTLWGRKKTIESSDTESKEIWDLYLDISGNVRIRESSGVYLTYEEIS